MHQLEIDGSSMPLRLSKPEGNYLRALIYKHTGLTQNNFAVHIDMDRSLLSRYLSGVTPITHNALAQIVAGIKYKEADILYEYKAVWETRIVIRPSRIGPTAPTADSTGDDVT